MIDEKRMYAMKIGRAVEASRDTIDFFIELSTRPIQSITQLEVLRNQYFSSYTKLKTIEEQFMIIEAPQTMEQDHQEIIDTFQELVQATAEAHAILKKDVKDIVQQNFEEAIGKQIKASMNIAHMMLNLSQKMFGR